jgi:hypothetical protein
MPIAVKPCEGRFSDEVLATLSSNRNRAQWANHACEVCGVAVGAKLDRGKWIPEQHWPSVKYQSRTATEKRQRTSADRMVSNDDAVLAESGSASIHLVRS